MVKYYNLVLLLFSGFLLSGSQCSRVDNATGTQPYQLPQFFKEGNFVNDTLLIQKFCDQAKYYLYLDVTRAMQDAKQALKLSQKYQWNKGKLISNNLISTCYLLDGSYDVLREVANETFNLAKSQQENIYTAHAKRFLGESYSEYQEWDSARVNFQYAIKIFEKMGQDSAMAVSMESLGNSFRDRSEYERAFKQYEEAGLIYEKIGSEWGKASILQNKGYLYIRQGDYVTAQGFFLEALGIFTKINNIYGQLNVLNDLSNAYNQDGKFIPGEDAARKAMKLAEIYHSDQQTNWALESLSRSLRGQNRLKEAMEYLEKNTYNRRRLHTGNLRRQFTMYQLMYENEQMGTAIQQTIIDEQRSTQRILIFISTLIIAFAVFLWFNNKKLRKKNAAIAEALLKGQTLERKRVAAELHDHLGGTLASLNWYLHGMDKKVFSPEEQKIYQSVHQMVSSAYKEVRSLSHNLMPAELQEHGLTMALSRLIDKMNESDLINFTFNKSGLEKRLSNQIEFELYSIVLELTNNILKHSGATEASISLVENPRNIHLSISDNGTGITGATKYGVGLGNVQSRVQSLSGKIDIRNQDGKGTLIDIEIPKPATY